MEVFQLRGGQIFLAKIQTNRQTGILLLYRSPNRRRQRAAREKFFEDRLGYPTKILISFRNDKHFMALILIKQ